MDFLGVGAWELVFIVLIAIIVIGPRDIGKTARSVGRFLNRLYKSEEWKAITQASRQLRGLPNRLAREAQLEEIQRTLDETDPDAGQGARPAEDGLEAWKPVSRRTPQEVSEPSTAPADSQSNPST